MEKVVNTKEDLPASRSQPERRKSEDLGHVVRLEDDEVRIKLQLPEHLGESDEEEAHLSTARRRTLVRTFEDVSAILLEAAFEADITPKQLDEQGQAAVDTLRLLVGGGSERLETLIEALERPVVEGYPDITDEDAEARARLRLHALYQRVIRDSYTVAELSHRPGISRQRLKQLRDQDRLFAINVPFQRGHLYPRWQFALSDGRPREEMPRLIAAAREGQLDAIGFHVLMNNAAAGGGLSPLDLLEDGEEQRVLEILRGADQ